MFEALAIVVFQLAADCLHRNWGTSVRRRHWNVAVSDSTVGVVICVGGWSVGVEEFMECL